MSTHPDAACNPNPRDPPVTTTIFPFSENSVGKSRSFVSAIFVGLRSPSRLWLLVGCAVVKLARFGSTVGKVNFMCAFVNVEV